jgi:hypothetical protein
MVVDMKYIKAMVFFKLFMICFFYYSELLTPNWH